MQLRTDFRLQFGTHTLRQQLAVSAFPRVMLLLAN
jgi:hypothetical protein